MKAKIRFGLYGCNMYRTRDLMDAARAAAGDAAQVAACFDIDAKRAGHAAEKYGGRVFATLDDFLAFEEMDVVLVSLPAYLHAEAFARCARAGKDVYLEKPICVDLAGREKIVSAFKEHPVRCNVGLSYRYVAPFRKVAEILRRPEAGRIIGAHHHWLTQWQSVPQSEIGWRHRLEQSGGQLIHHCCHLLDWFYWIGGPMRSVSASSYTPPKAELPHEERELTASFQYRDGGMATFNLSQDSHQYVQRGTVHAEGLGIEYQWGKETFVRVYQARSRAADETYEWSLSNLPGDGSDFERTTLQMKEFIDAYRNGDPMPITIEDGLRVFDFASGIRASYQSGQAVDVSGAGHL